MKTIIKLIMLLAVLGICIPAQAEILIYSKTIKCWVAENMGDDDWDIYIERIKGFLILEVVIEFDEIVDINDAVQIEYAKSGRERWVDIYFPEFDIEKITDGGKVQFVLTDPNFVDGDFWITMLTGAGKKYNIGLQHRQEIPRQLKGHTLWHDFLDINTICDMNMRIQQKFTKEANEGEMDLSDAYGIVQDWLGQRGWELNDLPPPPIE